jgi:hypothetical protein
MGIAASERPPDTLDDAAHQVWADYPDILASVREFLSGEWPGTAKEISSLDPDATE